MQFAKVFWNPNFGDYSGFDSVCDYVRAGRHACASVAEFLKTRAQIEETYAKQLLALAKSQAGVKLDGSIGKSWDAVLSSAQRASASHQKLADVFNQQSQLTNQLTKALKQKTKQREEDVRHCQNECRSLYDKALKNKTEFVKRADQRRQLEDEKERLKRDASNGGAAQSPSTAKEIQKIDQSIRKAITTADTSRQQCVSILEQLDGAKEQWESKTVQVLTDFNEMEQNRIVYLRSLFWALMNAISQSCVEVDKECDTVRNVILKCDPVTDLEEFITLRKTGEKRPGPITFENIGNATVTPPPPSQRSFKMSFGKKLPNPWKSSNGQSTGSSVQPKLPLQKLVPEPAQGHLDDTLSSSDCCSSPSLSPGSPACADKKANGENGFQGSSIGAQQVKHQNGASKSSQQAQAAAKPVYCLVTKTWADNQGTVLVQSGTKAKLLEKSSDALWFIELDDQQNLYCPVEYLQEII